LANTKQENKFPIVII